MKTIIITEFADISVKNRYIFDLSKIKVKNCIGCWSCWWKTPGRCVFNDLNEFYHEYVTADKAIFFGKVSKGFVSSNVKNLFDRMLPLFLPYTDYKTGESMHVPRYDKFPDIEFYYDGKFDMTEEKEIFESYVNRVFYQFHSKKYSVMHIEKFRQMEA